MPNPVLGQLIGQRNEDFSRRRRCIRVRYWFGRLLSEAKASKLVGNSLDSGFGEGVGIDGGAAEEEAVGFWRMGDEGGMELR